MVEELAGPVVGTHKERHLTNITSAPVDIKVCPYVRDRCEGALSIEYPGLVRQVVTVPGDRLQEIIFFQNSGVFGGILLKATRNEFFVRRPQDEHWCFCRIYDLSEVIRGRVPGIWLKEWLGNVPGVV
ncbi:MAG: hypothetical protein D5R96_07705 [Methanocalculus sp. MSAO_Arc2]|uniref:hypothetical protein n=1 Tax=Methanocalculus sp. MSAO_Arc2 TaxID=2293855 RepID=UPI000FF0D016|nr:MAG: hypothetical protein D5R96_07705 [Methanocalculus sp. MSAO_Arc2]